jgi:large conductance mechanosensitive channel
MLKEFQEFIKRGNVIDLAVAVVIGGAFTAIVKSLVDNIITPILGIFTGGIDFANLFIALNGESYDTLAAAQEAGAATINYGLFINAIISFVIIAFVVFLMVRTINNMQKKEETAAPPPALPEPSAEEKLLAEIRDLLAQKNK